MVEKWGNGINQWLLRCFHLQMLFSTLFRGAVRWWLKLVIEHLVKGWGWPRENRQMACTCGDQKEWALAWVSQGSYKGWPLKGEYLLGLGCLLRVSAAWLEKPSHQFGEFRSDFVYDYCLTCERFALCCRVLLRSNFASLSSTHLFPQMVPDFFQSHLEQFCNSLKTVRWTSGIWEIWMLHLQVSIAKGTSCTLRTRDFCMSWGCSHLSGSLCSGDAEQVKFDIACLIYSILFTLGHLHFFTDCSKEDICLFLLC